MSCFVVSKDHIDLLVSAMREHKVWCKHFNDFRYANELDPNTLGKMLWLENVKSYNSRYGKTDDPHEYVAGYKFKGYLQIPYGAIAKLAECYDYQSCEHDEWEASDANFCVQQLLSKLTHFLPGYEKAPWGVNDAVQARQVAGVHR